MSNGPDTTHVPGPFRFTTIAHASHRVLGPVSEPVIDDMLAEAAALVTTPAPRVLDIGCGKGEILVRAVQAMGGTGLGIEPNPAFAAAARRRIEATGLGIAIEERRWQDVQPAPRDVALAICTGSLHALGTFPEALHALHGIVSPGGLALVGPGYWKCEPEPGYLDALGATAEEMTTWEGTLELAARAGWQVRHTHASTLAEWDAYERRYAANVLAWCAAHPADPDSVPFHERIGGWSTTVQLWGRDTLGYALLLLQRD